MACALQEVVIWMILLLSGALVFLSTTVTSPSLHSKQQAESDGSSSGAYHYFQESWLFRLLINLLGYATIFVPGYLIVKYVRRSGYVDKAGSGCTLNLVRLCIYGSEDKLPASESEFHSRLASKAERTFSQETLVLMFCFVGLQGSYLTWGILQEKIMTQTYMDLSGEPRRFSDSQFLVFVNRILAFVLSGLYICMSRQPRHAAPLYKYSYCSFSNIMSSWCQYEALKYVSFPTQVLAKASKIIPVMLMGKCISKKKYEYYEYVTAAMISGGMTFFLLGSADDKKGSTSTTLSGVVILVSYMAFDSFTSNWQGELFSQYKVSAVQMMCGVNLFSCLLTSVSLTQQGGFASSLQFMLQSPMFTFDCFILSVCSAMGQLFIFYTISQFGAVVFVIIMTVRQGLAIILSCIIYKHAISPTGVIGVIIVFVAVFLRTYCNQRLKATRKKAAQVSAASLKV